jgi:Peptidase A4 family
MGSYSIRQLTAVGATVLATLALASPALARSAHATTHRMPEIGRLIGPNRAAGHHQVSGRPSAAPCPTNACSTNWSGYAVTSSNGAYTSVSTSWTQQAITNCTSTDPTGLTKNSPYAAFWDGLDGYNSSSVEQTGTIGYCSGKTAKYYAWYEMYPAGSVVYSNPVAPGDELSASVTYAPTTTVGRHGKKSTAYVYTLTLIDHGPTNSWTQSKQITTTTVYARSSAECITEAPYYQNVLPLADFGTVSYSSCDANGSPLTSSSSGLEWITMTNGTTGATESSTSAFDGPGDFSNTWVSS